ncbi:MAG TPA: ABC transporter substrate-binding protein [Actinomycetota bacterium]|nr:ABC transporter substrate-binding protein [Actinomycetota bacterium]
MRRRWTVLAASLLLTGAACGTRADFTALPSPVETRTISEEIVGTGGVVKGTTASGPVTPVTRRIRTDLRTGSGIRNGTIKIGGLFPMSGGLSALGVPPAKAAQAYFRYVNDRGGINGLKIDFDVCDDKADPNQSAACTDRLVNDDIFIMGPSFTPFSSNVVPILQRKGVPWVGYDGVNVEGFSSDIVVTVGAPIQTMGHALLPYWYRQVEARKGRAPKRLGVVYLDVAPARTYVTEAKNTICPKLGCEIVYEKRVTYFDLDYSTICLNLQAANVDGAWIVTDPASAVKMLVQCREAKYKPELGGFLGQHGVYLDLTMEQSGSFADGMIANSALMPPSVDNAAVRDMKRIVGTYEKNVDYGYFTALGYASARLTVDVLTEALKVDPKLTRASVLKAAARMTSYQCHGLCKDVNLTPPAAVHGGNHYVWMVRSKFDRASPDQWVLDGGPVDAWRSETWPRPGRP